MKATRRKATTNPHALEAFAVASLERREALAASELAEMLGGSTAAYRKAATKEEAGAP